MDMFTFSAVPESRGQDLPKIQLAEEVSTEFFIKMDPAALASLPLEKATKMELKRGQAEFHDASSCTTAIPINQRTNEDVPLLRDTSLTTLKSPQTASEKCSMKIILFFV